MFTAKSLIQERKDILNCFTLAYFQARSQQRELRKQWRLQ